MKSIISLLVLVLVFALINCETNDDSLPLSEEDECSASDADRFGLTTCGTNAYGKYAQQCINAKWENVGTGEGLSWCDGDFEIISKNGDGNYNIKTTDARDFTIDVSIVNDDIDTFNSKISSGEWVVDLVSGIRTIKDAVTGDVIQLDFCW